MCRQLGGPVYGIELLKSKCGRLQSSFKTINTMHNKLQAFLNFSSSVSLEVPAAGWSCLCQTMNACADEQSRHLAVKCAHADEQSRHLAVKCAHADEQSRHLAVKCAHADEQSRHLAVKCAHADEQSRHLAVKCAHADEQSRHLAVKCAHAGVPRVPKPWTSNN
jgi:hypothetical protein